MDVARDRFRPVRRSVGWVGPIGLCALVFLLCSTQALANAPSAAGVASAHGFEGLHGQASDACLSPPRSHNHHKASIAILSTGGALFVGSIIAAAVYGQHNGAKVELDERGTGAYASELQAAYQTASTSGLIATILWIATGVSLTTGLVVLGVEFASKPKASAAVRPPTQRTTPIATLGVWNTP